MKIPSFHDWRMYREHIVFDSVHMNHRKVLQISIPILVCLCLMLPATGAITVTDIDPSTGINADGACLHQ